MKQKGRTPPGAPIDHAAQLRERLGIAAYIADERNDTPWQQVDPRIREQWRVIGEAVMHTIVAKGNRQGDFTVSSIYGYASKKPYVNVEVSISPMQLSPGKAREIALMLLECADASESDSVLIKYTMEVLDLDQAHAAQLLNQFRIFREKQRGTEASSA